AARSSSSEGLPKGAAPPVREAGRAKPSRRRRGTGGGCSLAASMIDTHCHLDAPRLDPDRDQVLERAWANGVKGIVIPAIGPEDWEALFDFPARDPRIQFGLGIHPQLLPQLPEADDDAHLERLD